jgi:hypothetical protein
MEEEELREKGRAAIDTESLGSLLRLAEAAKLRNAAAGDGGGGGGGGGGGDGGGGGGEGGVGGGGVRRRLRGAVPPT